MFKFKREMGDHKVFSYDTKKHPFLEYLRDVYQKQDIENIHTQSQEYQDFVDGKIEDISDVETEIHKKFYEDIKSKDTFKKLYCSFIRDIYEQFFPNEPILIYQSFPSIRFQFIGSIAVPPHCDSDHIGKHPIGEKNFLLPITDMKGSARLILETKPEKGDFTPVDLEYGDMFYFNGNKCIHYNSINKENYTRISFDFRFLTYNDYMKYVSGDITTTNPRDPSKARKPTKMVIGGYYQFTTKEHTLNDMMKWHRVKETIPQSRPSFGEKETTAIQTYMSKGDPFLTEFKKTAELEQMICDYLGVKHCIMVSNGTVSLLAALLAYGIGVGDEVIIPNYTMVATINAVKCIGAIPILIDVDSDTYTISLDKVSQHVTDRTKAVIHVSLNNRSVSLVELANYCREKNICLIEDAAQSFGCKLNGKYYGTFGDVGSFSFSTPKIISMGQGGALVTDDDKIASKLRQIKNFGRVPGKVEVYDTFGLNLKITDLQAVVGIEQMKIIDEHVKLYRHIDSLYRCLLPPTVLTQTCDERIPWFIEIMVDDREKLAYFLKQHNIQTRITYPTMQSIYNMKGSFPNSDRISKKGLWLPTHALLTDDQIRYICDLIKIYYI